MTDMQKVATDPAAFREVLLVDTDAGPKPFAEVMDIWQRVDFVALDDSWQRLAGRGGIGGNGKQRAYLERPRGHSKTTDMAVMACWAIAFANRQLVGIAAARDADQAKLLRDAIDRLVRLNPWLTELVSVTNWMVSNTRTGSQLTIISADAGSAYGPTPHFVLVDEITHWSDKAGAALWEALFSSAAKRDDCLLTIISNAGCGLGTSWQWKLREAVLTDPDWHFSTLPGPQASWITAAKLAEQKRILPANAFARLWLNRWTTGAGDALDESEINAALVMDSQGPLERPEAGWCYGAGLDLGVSRDAAVLAIVGRHIRTARYKLACLRAWIPQETGRVDLTDVETAIKQAHAVWRFTQGKADPWQGLLLLDRLKAVRIPFETYSPAPTLSDEMARHVLGLFRDGNLAFWNHPRLVSELRATSCIEKNNGRLQLSWPRDGKGHGDHAMAFCLGIMAAQEARTPVVFSRPISGRRQHDGQMVSSNERPQPQPMFTQAEHVVSQVERELRGS